VSYLRRGFGSGVFRVEEVLSPAPALASSMLLGERLARSDRIRLLQLDQASVGVFEHLLGAPDLTLVLAFKSSTSLSKRFHIRMSKIANPSGGRGRARLDGLGRVPFIIQFSAVFRHALGRGGRVWARPDVS